MCDESRGNRVDNEQGPLCVNRRANAPLNIEADSLQDNDTCDFEIDDETVPLTSQDPLLGESSTVALLPDSHQVVRSRYAKANSQRKRNRHGNRKGRGYEIPEAQRRTPWMRTCLLWFCRSTRAVQSTISCMNLLARLLFWTSILASILGVFWYSYELYNHG